MNARAQRAVRAVAGTGVATVTAAVSHTVGGGVAPSPALVLGIALLMAPLGVVLVGRRLALSRVALTVLLSQAALHVTFALVGMAPAGALDSPAHGHGAMTLGGFDAPVAALMPDTLMLGAHLVAALATIGLLYRGEAALATLARFVLDLAVPRLVEFAPPGSRRVLVATGWFGVAGAPATATAPILRRGPPPPSRIR